jgi:hypothetical protein
VKEEEQARRRICLSIKEDETERSQLALLSVLGLCFLHEFRPSMSGQEVVPSPIGPGFITSYLGCIYIMGFSPTGLRTSTRPVTSDLNTKSIHIMCVT